MAAASALWAGRELRNRWRALLVLGVVAGLAAAVVLAAVAGARRTASAYDRYRDETQAPDVLVFGTLLGAFGLDYSAVKELPEVAAAGEFALAPVGSIDPFIGTLPPADDQLYRTVSRPLIREGRLPRPDRHDEIVINRDTVKLFGLGVGDTLVLDTVTSMEDMFAGKQSGGPRIEVTVVGIGNSFIDEVFFGGDEEGGFTPSAALLEEYPEIPRATNLVVRLAPGVTVREFTARAQEVLRETNPELLSEVGATDAAIPVRDLAEDRKRFIHGTDLERTALLLFAAAAALAAVVLVGQAVARAVYAMADAVPPLRALGMTGLQLVNGLVRPVLVTAAVAALVSVPAAILLSRLFPVGLARRLDPDLGTHTDWLVLAPGAALVALLTVTGAVLAAVRATRARAPEGAPKTPALVRGLRNVAPLPLGIGAGLALDPGRGRRSLPVRPAIAGGVAGIIGIVGAFGLVRGIDDAVDDPALAGQAWDVVILPDSPEQPVDLEALEEHPDVESFAVVRHDSVDVQGASAPLFAVRPGDRLAFVTLAGRAPAGADEAAVAPSTLETSGRAVGDSIQLGGQRVTIVGKALLPQTPHSSFDQGVWMTAEGAERVAGPVPPSEVYVRARDGVSGKALADDLADLATDVSSASVPQDVVLLRNVRTLPRALAGFLALLGVAALGHALVTTVRRRRVDFAVLRAIGFRPAQARACIAWQATTVGVVALVLGLPLGIALGRTAWRLTAEATPLLYVAPIAAAAIAVTVPAVLVTANALAALPARRAGRIRPAVVLRTE